MLHILFKALPRIAVLITLLDVLTASANNFLRLLFNFSKAVPSLAANPVRAVAELAVFPLAVLSVAFPSPMTLSLVFVAQSISVMGVDPGLASRFLPTLLVLSILDVLSSHYRKGQEKYVRFSNLLPSLPLLVAFIAPLVVVPIAAEGFTRSLLNAVVSSAGKTKILGLLSANPLFTLAIAVAIGATLYKYTSSLSETAVVFLAKPRDLAMEKLRGTEDLDVWFRLPLTSFRSMLVALVFAPPLYHALITLLEPIWQRFEFTSELAEVLLKALLLLAVSAVVWRVMARAFRGLELNVKRVLALSIASTVAIYVAGVYRSTQAVGLSVDALLRPDLLGVVERIGEVYISYYDTIFLILDHILKLLGVAP
ncbi:MAG: hypothetical protein QW706_08550 [Candidatus Nezhaarchaeales archaeon]